MRGIEKLQKRLNFYGGNNQQKRMKKDKLKTLKKALIYSYQSGTIITPEGKEFRGLINSNKLQPEYDYKILSIPFEDICLNEEKIGKTSEGIQKTNLHAGDVFEWKDNGTYWIIYLERLAETAYYRADIRRCKYEIEIEGKKYKVAIRGPIETTITWNQKKNKVYNELSYSLSMIITRNEETSNYFHRFAKIKFDNKNWEVQSVNRYDGDGIIEVFLDEYYSNEIEDEIQEVKRLEDADGIEGEPVVYPYDTVTYIVKGYSNGEWQVPEEDVRVAAQNGSEITLDILSEKRKKIEIKYITEDKEITYPILIDSL